jgi:glycosyltransferase 2 family protein
LQEPQKKDSLASKIVKQVIAIGFGALFLWLAFRNANLAQIWSYARTVEPLYLVLLCVSCISSHLCRAWRWTIFLSPLSSRKISLFNSFAAIFVCYAVNLVIPRGGEVARIVSISKSEGLPWGGVLPTMLIDRLLDVAILCLIFAITIPVLPATIHEQWPALRMGGILMAVGSVGILVLLPKLSNLIRYFVSLPSVKKLLPEKILLAAEKLAEQFQEGTKSLSTLSTYPAVLLSTVVMWGFYFLNQWFLMSGFHLTSKISLLQQWIIFTVSSVGVLIPSPGSIGGFHWFMSQSMILTAGTDKDLALAFATVMHLMTFLIVPCITALICVLIQANQTPRSPAPPPEAVVPKVPT